MSQTKRRIRFRPASALLLGALAMLLAQSVAHAGLAIIGGAPEDPSKPVPQGVGDAGGTSFSNTTGSAGQGLPTLAGGWPSSPNFAPDASFPPPSGGALGIAGVSNLGAPLTVSLDNSQAGPVTFTFFGKGNATLSDSFQVNGQTLFTSNSSQGDTAVVNLSGGPINFSWLTGQGVTVSNGSSSAVGSESFFAGVDPYQTPYSATTGNTVFVGLADRPGTPPDHNFQDLTVRITSVPEPASLITGSTAALIIGLACAWSRRRKRASA